MKLLISHGRLLSVTTFLVLSFAILPVYSQKMDRIARGQAVSMLDNVRKAIKADYYDPTFKGMDIDARFAQAEERLKAVDTLSQAFAVIAQAVIDLEDSHTTFYPPARNAIIEYGWRMKMFGDKAFITGVKEKSDADAKGLQIGDQVLKMNGFAPTRKDLWKMIYYYRVINPQTKIRLEIQKPDGTTATLDVEADVKQLKRVVNLWDSIDFNEAVREGSKLANADRHYFKTIGAIQIWKMPDFAFEPGEVGGRMAEAKGKGTLILDLRGNPGGYVVTLEKLAGYFFDKETKIADLKGRKPFKPQIARSQGADVFTGKVIVLLDSGSGSAAEIFGRLMQIEKRGIVLGDVSAGAVMMSRGVGFDAGVNTMISYGMNLTRADVIMTDGKSIEHVGVVPDETVIPTGEDLAKGRDPVLARALTLAGVNVSPEDAGNYFPREKFIERSTNFAINLVF
ncbi:MAG TPA: S41 family peptidase [Pyrinomonadaceae bacterium]